MPRTLTAEEILATGEAKAIYEYVLKVKGERWPEGEKVVKNDPIFAYRYARDIVVGRWPEAEPTMIKDAHAACMYAKFCLQKRWLKAESVIVQDAEWAYEYALSVMKGRWPEAEPVIALSREWAAEYSKNVVKGTFPEAKPTEGVKMESEAAVLEAVKTSLDTLRLPGTDKYKPAEIGAGKVTRQFRNFDYPEFYPEEKVIEVLKRHFSGMKEDCFKLVKGAGSWLTVEVAPKVATTARPRAQAAQAAPAGHPSSRCRRRQGRQDWTDGCGSNRSCGDSQDCRRLQAGD